MLKDFIKNYRAIFLRFPKYQNAYTKWLSFFCLDIFTIIKILSFFFISVPANLRLSRYKSAHGTRQPSHRDPTLSDIYVDCHCLPVIRVHQAHVDQVNQAPHLSQADQAMDPRRTCQLTGSIILHILNTQIWDQSKMILHLNSGDPCTLEPHL